MISNTTMATALLFCLTISGHRSHTHQDTTTSHSRSTRPSPFRDSSPPAQSSQHSPSRDTTWHTPSAQRSPFRDTTWHPLFNGKDLSGWTHVGPGGMSVDNGLIRGHGGMGLLYYKGHPFSNCTFRIIYRMKDTNDNSGVFIRIPVEPREEWMPVHYGYEVQIDNHPETSGEDDYHITGTLYSMTRPLAKPSRPGPEWNTMEITLDGPRTIVTVNGIKVTDYTEGAPVPPRKFDFEPLRGRRPDTGYFGIQNHSDKDIVFFKEISVRYAK